MLSLDLRQILPPKMPFFVHQKCKFRQKQCRKSRSSAISSNFVKFRQKSMFSPRRPIFVILSVFRQKRNSLEPADADADRLQSNIVSVHSANWLIWLYCACSIIYHIIMWYPLYPVIIKWFPVCVCVCGETVSFIVMRILLKGFTSTLPEVMSSCVLKPTSDDR